MTADHGYTHRATVVAVAGVAHYVEVPALGIGTRLGPMLSTVPGLAPGDAVLVSQLGTQRDVLAITGRMPGRFPDQEEIPGLTAAIDDLQAADAALESALTAGQAADDARLDILETTTGGHTATLAGHTTELADHEARLDALTHWWVYSASGSTVNTNSLTFVGLGSDDVSFTRPYPPSGMGTLWIRGAILNSQVNVYGFMGFEIRDNNASGTVRITASKDASLFALSTAVNVLLTSLGGHFPVSGLPTTGTMFVRAMYCSDGTGNSAQAAYRSMGWIPSP